MARRSNKKPYSKGGSNEKGNYKQGKGTGSKSSSNPSTKEGETTEEGNSGGTSVAIPTASNDPEWYDRDPALTTAAANIPFSLPFGARYDLFKGVSVSPGSVNVALNHDACSAGICSVLLKPSMGVNLSKSSPANVCANALYTHVRYMNSGRKNYDPVDLFMYASVFGDIYSFVNWCIRIYHYAFMYSQRNWYIARDLLIANGIDPISITAQLANYRYWLNSIINKVSSFCVPSDIYYFKRRIFLYANYYIENPNANIKDQLYQFVPDGFYCFDYDARQAGKLRYQQWDSTTLHGLSDLQYFFEAYLMINITGDEDFGLMSGDIKKAYGDNIMVLSSIPEEGGLLPVYDSYVLSQFRNCFTAGVDRADNTKTYVDLNGDAHVFGDIEQSTDGLVVSCEGFASWSATVPRHIGLWAAGKHLLTVENPMPNTGDVIEATRLMPHLGLIPAGSGTYQYVLNCGTEIAVSTRITYSPADNSGNIYQSTHGCIVASSLNDLNIQSGNIDLRDVYQRIQFKYAPILYVDHIESNGGGVFTAEMFYPFANLDNTTEIDNDTLMRIHEVALLSLFYVPGVAKLA